MFFDRDEVMENSDKFYQMARKFMKSHPDVSLSEALIAVRSGMAITVDEACAACECDFDSDNDNDDDDDWEGWEDDDEWSEEEDFKYEWEEDEDDDESESDEEDEDDESEEEDDSLVSNEQYASEAIMDALGIKPDKAYAYDENYNIFKTLPPSVDYYATLGDALADKGWNGTLRLTVGAIETAFMSASDGDFPVPEDGIDEYTFALWKITNPVIRGTGTPIVIATIQPNTNGGLIPPTEDAELLNTVDIVKGCRSEVGLCKLFKEASFSWDVEIKDIELTSVMIQNADLEDDEEVDESNPKNFQLVIFPVPID